MSLNNQELTIKELVNQAYQYIQLTNKNKSQIGMVIKNKVFKNKKLIQYLNTLPQHNLIEKIYWIYHNLKEYPKCKYCNKENKRFISFDKGYHNFCSRNCAMLAKYGTTSNFNNKEEQIKIKNTIKEKYNGIGFQSKIILQKIKNTEIQKYGKIYQKTQQRLQKIKNTTLQKYGVEHHMKTNQSKEKYLKHRNYHEQSFISKVKESIKTKIPKMAKSQRDNFYNKLQLLVKNKFQLLFSKDQYKGNRNNKTKQAISYPVKCLTCNNIFNAKINNLKRYNGFNCPYCNKHFESIEENSIYQFCKIYFPNTIHRDRHLLKKYELDIVIPQINLAIQYNGIYWHSIQNKNNGYHLMKTQLCQNLGYRLIHIWQDQWINNKEEIKQKLINIFENKEFINYNQLLPRDWYQLKEIQNYKLEILQPKIITRNNFKCENTGYLKYTKI